jgi:hypothetical protein
MIEMGAIYYITIKGSNLLDFSMWIDLNEDLRSQLQDAHFMAQADIMDLDLPIKLLQFKLEIEGSDRRIGLAIKFLDHHSAQADIKQNLWLPRTLQVAYAIERQYHMKPSCLFIADIAE